MEMICRFYHIVYYIYCLASVIVGFGSFAVLGCKDCKDLPGTTFAVCFPENNCTPLHTERLSANQIQAFNGPVV